MRTVEGTRVRLLRQMTRNRAWRNTYGTWVTPTAGEVMRESGIQTAAIHTNCRQSILVQWVTIRLILELCARE